MNDSKRDGNPKTEIFQGKKVIKKIIFRITVMFLKSTVPAMRTVEFVR